MYKLIICLFFSPACLIQAQNANYQEIDGFARKLPWYYPNAKELANSINELDTNDRCEARALFVWITRNIKYEVEPIKSNKISSDLISFTLETGKAKCYGYAVLFDSVCNYLGITSQLIPGYVKEGFNPRSGNHLWNAIKIEGEWYFVDPTWGSGYVEKVVKQSFLKKLFKKAVINNDLKYVAQMDDQYFMAEPGSILETHLPADPMWQLKDYPSSLDCFITENPECKGDTSFFSVSDSLRKHEQLNQEEKLIASSCRANQFNKLNYSELASAHIQIGLSHYNISETMVPESLEYHTKELKLAHYHLKNGLLYLDKTKQINDSIYRSNVVKFKADYKTSVKNLKDYQKIISKSISNNNKLSIKATDEKDKMNQQISRYYYLANNIMFDEKIYLIERAKEIPDYLQSLTISNYKLKIDSISSLLALNYDTINILLDQGLKVLFDSIEDIRNSIPGIILFTDSLSNAVQNVYFENQFNTFALTGPLYSEARNYYGLLSTYHSTMDTIIKLRIKEKHDHLKNLFKNVENEVKESKRYLVEIKRLSIIDQNEESINDSLNIHLYNACMNYLELMEHQKGFFKGEKSVIKFEVKVMNDHLDRIEKTNDYLTEFYRYNNIKMKNDYANEKAVLKDLTKKVTAANNVCLKTLGE